MDAEADESTDAATISVVALQTRACGRCAFRHQEGQGAKAQHFCRLNPPTAFMAMAQGPLGRPQQMAMSTWPPVQLDQWCGQFKPRVMM